MNNRKILVTLGGTREPIDSVRWIGNESSGRMGYELLKVLIEMHYDVTAMVAFNNIERLEWEFLSDLGLKIIHVKSTLEMHESVLKNINENQPEIYLSVAAVADYRPKNISIEKIKREHCGEEFTITLVQNPDIIKTVANLKINRPRLVIGFAAEDSNKIIENMRKKLINKNLNMVIGNSIAAIGSTKNQVYIMSESHEIYSSELLDKNEIAKIIVEKIEQCEDDTA